MSYTHNKGFSATESGFAIQKNGVDTPVIDANGNLIGAITGSISIEKADSYALTSAESKKFVISLKNTGNSKTFTLGLEDGQVALVYNHGTESFTLKNVSGDTGTTVATTKLYLVIGSKTANASKVIALN